MVVTVRSVLGRRSLLRARLVWHSLRWMPAMAEAAADDAFCALRVRGKRRPLDGERGARACVVSVGSALDLEPHRMRWAGERRPADGPAGLPPAHAGLSAVDGSSGGPSIAAAFPRGDEAAAARRQRRGFFSWQLPLLRHDSDGVSPVSWRARRAVDDHQLALARLLLLLLLLLRPPPPPPSTGRRAPHRLRRRGIIPRRRRWRALEVIEGTRRRERHNLRKVVGHVIRAASPSRCPYPCRRRGRRR